jgi:hypothetical protein
MSAPTSHRSSIESAGRTDKIDKQSGILAILARPFWMFFGNFILLISVANIFAGEIKTPYVSDFVFWGVVVALIIVRFLDIKFLNGQTAAGKPATIKHWRNYAILLVVISAAVWAAAHWARYLFKS